MGYVDKEMARAQKAIGDAVAGKGLQKAIKALQDKSKIVDSLKPLPARGAITAKRKVAKRTGSAGGADRQELSRTYYTTVRELRSSDGLFCIQYTNLSSLTFDAGVDRLLDFDPEA